MLGHSIGIIFDHIVKVEQAFQCSMDIALSGVSDRPFVPRLGFLRISKLGTRRLPQSEATKQRVTNAIFRTIDYAAPV